MKKAIANLSFSDLKVRYFTGRSILISDTGQGKRYQYRNGCMTALGDLEISEWREMITELIAYPAGRKQAVVLRESVLCSQTGSEV